MALDWPPPPAVAARWLTRARRVAALSGTADADADAPLLHGGLAALCDASQLAPAATLLAVVEILSARRPALSLMLAAAWCAASASASLAPAKRGKAAVADDCAGIADALDPASSLPAFIVHTDGRGWRVQGSAAWIGAASESPLLVFAHHADAHAVSAFLLPADAPGICPAQPGEASGQAELDLTVGPERLLGPAGQARDAMVRVDALRRLAASAQATGVALAAYDAAVRMLPMTASAPPRAALELAACASALAAVRAMLQAAGRAADASQDIRLLSAMTLLSAAEAAERMLAAGLKMAAASPSPEPPPLQALMRARHLHQATAGPQEAQAVLLASAILPASNHPSSLPPASGASRAMSHAPLSRAGDPPDRVAEILDAAADAFTQQTYDTTTLDQIGEALGVTKGSIYHHYRSKAHLFTAVYQRALEMNIATVEPIARQAGVRAIDRLYRMAYAHAMQVMKHLSYQRVAVQGLESHLMGRINEEQRARLDEVISLRDHYEELFVNVLAQAIEAGELPRQNARLAAKPLFGAINWTTMWYQPRPGETAADRDRLAAHLATFVLSGLTQAYQPPASEPAGKQAGSPAAAHGE